MNKNSIEKLIENMGKDIEEKISIEIKKNNGKIIDIILFTAQVIILIAIVYMELTR